MAEQPTLHRSDYYFSLDKESKRRYNNKLSLLNNEDPYLLGTGFSEEADILPCLKYPDIVNYLLFTTSFVTKEEVKNYKSLESYKYFTAGWVQAINWKVYGEVVVVRGKVKHSYRVNEPPLSPWAIIQNNGTVVCGHCTCMAGLAETCSHIGALLYWVETAVRIRDDSTCTSKKNMWLMPNVVSNIPYLRLKDIKTGTSSLSSISYIPQDSCLATENELSSFYSKLSKCDKKPIALSLISPHNKDFIQALNHLPVPLQTLFNPDNLQKNYLEILDIAEQFEQTVTPTMQDHLQEATRAQASSKKWYKYRAGRITASRFYAVLHTNAYQPTLSLVRAICYPESSVFRSDATDWGCSHEKEALQAYKTAMHRSHTNFQLIPCGFFISLNDPYLGASPDSLVQCSCHGKGVVEVKCPYCAREEFIADATSNAQFCLEKLDDGRLTLKTSHPYYYQCQLQLHVTGFSYCDFVVWTNKDLVQERILVDKSFLATALPKAEFFFCHCILPELLSKWYSREHTISVPTYSSANGLPDDEDNGSWCYCKQPCGGDMVACDNKSCPNKWYHMTCLQMKSPPKGKWHCPTCHACKKAKKS